MPLQIVRNDITRMKVDAIVNSTNRHFIGCSGADGFIHRAAGSELDEVCLGMTPCGLGEVKETQGFLLPCRYVFHTVAPEWMGGRCGERVILKTCYQNALDLALKKGCRSIAFPLMSAGVRGFPGGEALSIANNTIKQWLAQHDTVDMDVYLVVYDKKSFILSKELYKDVEQFIDDYYVRKNREKQENNLSLLCTAPQIEAESRRKKPRTTPQKKGIRPFDLNRVALGTDFENFIQEKQEWKLDESFSQMLFRKIDEKGIKDSECYTRANVSKQVFSKIRSIANYHPAKMTVLALAIALELPLPETELLLSKAGYALSDSYLGDVIIRYFIEHGFYNIYDINAYLFDKDQPLLF